MVKPVNKFESVINASNVLKESRNKKSTVESKKTESKKLREAYSDPSEMSPEELCNYYNDGYFELYPKSEDLAMPWDADLSYDKSRNEYILEGGIAPGGGYKASVVARIPASEFWSLFEKA